jgi:hypothetical protein
MRSAIVARASRIARELTFTTFHDEDVDSPDLATYAQDCLEWDLREGFTSEAVSEGFGNGRSVCGYRHPRFTAAIRQGTRQGLGFLAQRGR